MSEDLPSDFLDMDEDFDDWFGKSLEHSKFLDEERHVFKDPDRVFNEINIGKLNYFHLIITIKINWAYSGNLYPYSNFYVYDYLFSKTKGNAYLFKTKFNEKCYREYLCDYKWTVKKIRYCDTKEFKHYYFINNEIELKGYDNENEEEKNIYGKYLFIDSEEENQKFWDEFDFDEFNSVKITELNNSFFDSDYLGNNLETFHLDILEEESNIIEYVKKWSELKCFIIDYDCKLENSQLIELLKNLSSLKSLFLIDIFFQKKLILNPKEKKNISELFPNLSIDIKKKSSSLKWMYSEKKIEKN